MYKYLIVIGAFFLIGYGLIRLYFHLTAGFSIDNITAHLEHHPEWEIRALTKDEKQEANEALNQTYTYWAKGHQSYVFLSEDGKYVMKFIKFQRVRVNPWFLQLPRPAFVEKWLQDKIDSKNSKLNDLFLSWVIGFNDLKDENGLVMVHLNQTNSLKKQVTIVDNLGFKHILNLDDQVFLVQKRGKLLYTDIEHYVQKHEMDKAKILLSEVLTFLVSEYQKGIAEKDQHLERNLGIIDGKVRHIDAGRFIKGEEYKNPSIYRNELVYKLVKFRSWLQGVSPELADYFTQELNQVN